MTTIGEEKRHNLRVAGRSRAGSIHLINNLGLPMPKLVDVTVPTGRACGLAAPAGAQANRTH
ncbi:hypothetical protein [Myxococcus xanthus]|uniref:hypothetical protein n=1 Tax=Myxococcus xanthus TaxID=34 RepID=UPI001163FF3F|nr:hypothetical protein BHS07_29900 [Myxococcus xanthus]